MYFRGKNLSVFFFFVFRIYDGRLFSLKVIARLFFFFSSSPYSSSSPSPAHRVGQYFLYYFLSVITVVTRTTYRVTFGARPKDARITRLSRYGRRETPAGPYLAQRSASVTQIAGSILEPRAQPLILEPTVLLLQSLHTDFGFSRARRQTFRTAFHAQVSKSFFGVRPPRNVIPSDIYYYNLRTQN